MSVIEKFEDIVCWQKGLVFTSELHKCIKSNSDFGFTSQITRATYSITNNIAEGFERDSPKEFKRFLNIAKSSAAEVRSMLYVGKEIGYFETEVFETLRTRILEITKLISGFIRYLENKII